MKNKVILRQNEVQFAAGRVAGQIQRHWADTGHFESDHINIYGVPRGGVPAAYLVSQFILKGQVVDTPSQAHYFVDDIIDSGATRARYKVRYPSTPFFALWENPADWLVFPWEGNAGGSAEDIPTRLLQYIGEDPKREGLVDTPRRFIKAWGQYTEGYSQEPADLLKCFEDGAEEYNEMVLVKDIPVYSHCEHHLAPFFGVAHVAYIPHGKVLGLSKFARLVNVYARRLQVQERMTKQIAHALANALHPIGVGVMLECRHLCMESRGVRAQGSSTTTSCLLGAFLDDPAARAEFLRMVR